MAERKVAEVTEVAGVAQPMQAEAAEPKRAGITGRLRAFLAFWYDFVVGDDWLVAVGVVVGLAVTYALSKTAVPAWWLLPLLIAGLLPLSLWRAARRR
jgi:hypothetical protein